MKHKGHFTLSMVALLLVSAAGLPVQAADETLSETAVASDVITMAETGQATVSVTANKQIASSTYAGGHLLGNWSASVTSGTVAWRLNPTVVRPYSTATYSGGYVTSTMDSSRQIEISLTTDSGCAASQLSGQWRYCPQGVTSVSGNITTVTGKNQTLASGTYPVAIDAAVWSF